MSSTGWLPVKYRIQFKIAVFMHQVTAQRCPSYVADLVAFWTLSDDLCVQRRLVQPSFNEHVLISDEVRLMFVARAFGTVCHRRYTHRDLSFCISSSAEDSVL